MPVSLTFQANFSIDRYKALVGKRLIIERGSVIAAKLNFSASNSTSTRVTGLIPWAFISTLTLLLDVVVPLAGDDVLADDLEDGGVVRQQGRVGSSLGRVLSIKYYLIFVCFGVVAV